MTKNDKRAAKARNACTAYNQDKYAPVETGLVDFLTDAMHLFSRMEFNEALRMAREHFKMEETK